MSLNLTRSYISGKKPDTKRANTRFIEPFKAPNSTFIQSLQIEKMKGR